MAIVGSRKPVAEAASFARILACCVASRGSVVVSGGALGIDRAAHEGALDAGAETWVVLPCGTNHEFPRENSALFAKVASDKGAVIYPFADDQQPAAHTFLSRNGVLVALADCVVIVQAGLQSGSRNAASWARRLGRPLWVVPGAAWSAGFEGSTEELKNGAIPLWSLDHFREAIFGKVDAPPQERLPARQDRNENEILRVIRGAPCHVDKIITASGVPAAEAASALLTLALEDVVVEGPERWFRLHGRFAAL